MSNEKGQAGEEPLERAEEAYAAAQEAFEDGLDQAHRYLKRQWSERPITVAAAAIGVGVVIGLLLGGSRR